MPSKKTSQQSKETAPATALTMADLLVLSLLSEHAMHGYKLLREFESQEVSEWARVSRPHVYYALQKLSKLGLINATLEKQANVTARSMTTYQVSQEGAAALNEHLGRLDWAAAKSPPPFTSWYGLSIHADPLDRKKILASRVSFLEDEIKRKQQTLEFIRTYQSVRAQTGLELVDLYIQQCRTELKWIESLKTI